MVSGIGTFSGRGRVWRNSDLKHLTRMVVGAAQAHDRPALYVNHDGFHIVSRTSGENRVENVMPRDELFRDRSDALLNQFHLPLLPLNRELLEVDQLEPVLRAAIELPGSLLFSANPYVAAAARDAAGQEATELEPWKLAVAADFIAGRIKITPRVIIALGSGLQDLPDEVQGAVRVPFHDVPFWPKPVGTVAGHRDEIIAGKLEGQDVALLAGRYHMYQGVSALGVVRPLRTFRVLGGEFFIATNAVGGLRPEMKVGDLLLVTDVTYHFGSNPLVGPNFEEWGSRFPDMTRIYDPHLQQYARGAAGEAGMTLHEGTLNMQLGPHYETPATIRELQQLGNAGVGQSHVPEVIASSHMGMRTLGVSLISNMAAGITGKPLDHEEVQEAGRRVAQTFKAFARSVVRQIGSEIS